jgi:inositol transporter-like SP family MFS transporter
MTSVSSDARMVNPWWIAIVCGMASYIDACAMVGSGIALVIYQHSFGLTPDQFGILSSDLTFCIATGALLGGRLGDKYGRRSVFIITMAMIVIGSGMLTMMISFYGLFIGTLLVGLGTGADLPVSLAAIAEVATEKNRGKLLGFSQIMWALGVLGALGCSAIVGEDYGRLSGQIMYGQVGFLALITMILRIGIPESSKWKTALAERLAGENTIQAKRASLRDLLKAPYMVPFIALLLFYSLTNLGANTFSQFFTYLWVNVIGESVRFASIVTAINLSLGCLWSYWFMKIADTPKRFNFFQIGAVALLMMFLLPTVFGISTIVLIVGGIFGFFGIAFAFESIMKVWTQESFPTLLRTTAQGTIIATSRYLAAGLAMVTPRIMESSPRTLFFILSGLTFAGIAAAWIGFHKGTTNVFEVEDQTEQELEA